ncbi:hypothetical protein AAMO2058_000654300 [Amorphochlora amoebiformis]
MVRLGWNSGISEEYRLFGGSLGETSFNETVVKVSERSFDETTQEQMARVFVICWLVTLWTVADGYRC